jgi:hypothetical protein
MRRPSPKEARAAFWAIRAWRRARNIVNESGVADLRLPRAPHLGLEATTGVDAILRRTDPTCLVRSAVLQRWFADQGDFRELVIGVTAPKQGFRAHAWLEPPGDATASEYVEVMRLPAMHS